MALVLKDRVKETTPTTGTGTFTLAGAMSGFQAFSVIGNANTTYYAIYEPSGTAWEVGLGTYTLSGTTLSRDTILASSNANAVVNFGAGTKIIFCTYPAGKSIYYGASGESVLTGPLLVGAAASTAPSADVRLEIFGNNTGLTGDIATNTLRITDLDATTAADQPIGKLEFYGSDATSPGAGVKSYILSASKGTSGGGDLRFGTSANAGTVAENMRLTSTQLSVNGSMLVGAAALASATSLEVSRNISGGTTSLGVVSNGEIQSTVTTGADGFRSAISTQATTFTLASLRHFNASQGTIGVDSVVTSQFGFFVGTTLIGATNNYGFYSAVNSGTGRWNLYAVGTASNYMAGDLLLGTTTPDTATPKLDIVDSGGVQLLMADSVTDATTKTARFGARHYTNAEEPFGIMLQSTSTNNVLHYGGGTSLINAATIHAFYTAADNITTTGTERMRINSAGSVGIGTTSLTGYTLRVTKNLTGAVSSHGIVSDGVVQSDVTTSAYGVRLAIATQAAAFTLPSLFHISVDQGTLGATSAITNQYGVIINTSLTGATNNYGFYGNIASGTNRWNFYANGTANNYMAGSLGVGTTSVTDSNLRVEKNITGGTSAFGIRSAGNVQSDVTSVAYGIRTAVGTQAASFTLSELWHLHVDQNTFGVGSVVTNQSGVRISSALTGATNNFGFYSGIASGTGRWNFYAAGTAANYFAGDVQINAPGTGSTSALTSSATQTVTNKRINPRVVTAAATTGTITPNGDTTDLYKAEGLTGAITIDTPSGTPVDGQKLMIRLEDDGTARGITWTTSAGGFRALGITLPTTTVLGKVTYVGCVYNSTDSFWDAVATVTQA